MTPPEAEITELPSSPGARLKREREASGLSEQQAAESLNLDPTVITVLEANDFAALGAPVFAKGHLRRYAALLGLDEDEIVGAYERSKQHVDEPTLVPRARIEMAPVRGRRRWPWVFGGTAAFLVAALVLAYLSEHGLPWSDDAADEAATTDTSVETTQSLPTQGPGAAPNDASARGTNAADPAAQAPAASTPGDGAAGGVAPGPGQVSLQLRFSGDSWVEIFDGSGKAVLYDLGKAGTERTITATAPLSVTLGNAPAVAIAVNGRALPPPPAQGPVARFSIGADGTLR
ncbi:MAG TPA: RodZ domain-containing protein [Steroidobacteraceae bacterium]